MTEYTVRCPRCRHNHVIVEIPYCWHMYMDHGLLNQRACDAGIATPDPSSFTRCDNDECEHQGVWEDFYTDEPDDHRTYTVILLYPDYTTNCFGQDTYMTSVSASNPTAAVHAARAEVIDAFEEDDRVIHDPTDLFVIAVIEGKHHDVNPGI